MPYSEELTGFYLHCEGKGTHEESKVWRLNIVSVSSSQLYLSIDSVQSPPKISGSYFCVYGQTYTKVYLKKQKIPE